MCHVLLIPLGTLEKSHLTLYNYLVSSPLFLLTFCPVRFRQQGFWHRPETILARCYCHILFLSPLFSFDYFHLSLPALPTPTSEHTYSFPAFVKPKTQILALGSQMSFKLALSIHQYILTYSLLVLAFPVIL